MSGELEFGSRGTAVDASESDDGHGFRAGAAESGGGFVERGSSGEHVVEKQEPASGDLCAFARAERSADVGAALGVGHAGLGLRAARADEKPLGGNAGDAGEAAGQARALIEAAAEEPPPVERHGHDGVEADVARERSCQPRRHGRGQRGHSAVLEEVKEPSQPSLVGAVGVGGLEGGDAAAAEGAEAALVERAGVQERGPADLAEVFGDEDRRRREAVVADGGEGECFQRDAADGAIAGQQRSKRGGRGGKGPGEKGAGSASCQWGTAEDPPPEQNYTPKNKNRTFRLGCAAWFTEVDKARDGVKVGSWDCF